MSILQVIAIEQSRATPVLFQVPFTVSSVVVSQCSSRAVILSTDGRVFSCIVELPESMRVVGFPAGVSLPIKKVAISPDGRFIAAVDNRGRLFLEDIEKPRPMTRVGAADQVATVVIRNDRLAALDVTGHIWVMETIGTNARRVTDKTSIPAYKLAISALHILVIGKSDRAIRRCSFHDSDATLPPLLIPGMGGELDIQPFPQGKSAGDDFFISTADNRVFWLTVKLERFVLKSLDLPIHFAFREMYVTMSGLFFNGHRGSMHRLDWQVVKQTTTCITPQMLLPFSVAPVRALIDSNSSSDGFAVPDVRPEKVAFGLVHALFLWVGNEQDRTGELKTLMSEISSVLQETHELKKQIAVTTLSPSLESPQLKSVYQPHDRERLLRDGLMREAEIEKAADLRRVEEGHLAGVLGRTVDSKCGLEMEKDKLTRAIIQMSRDCDLVDAEVSSMRSLKTALLADLRKVEPLVEELQAKLKETSANETKLKVRKDVSAIDAQLLGLGSEIRTKKLILSDLANERESLLRSVHELLSVCDN